MASAWAKEETLGDSSASLLALRDWEVSELGTFKDTDLDQTLRILKSISTCKQSFPTMSPKPPYSKPSMKGKLSSFL